MKTPWILVLCSALGAFGCTAGRQPRLVETTIRIDSTPPGALVSYSPTVPFDAAQAAPMGKTPLMRYSPIPEGGAAVQITSRGYEPWVGTLSPSSPNIRAELRPLCEAEKAEGGWTASAPIDRITVIPLRVGSQKIGDAFQKDVPTFRNAFLSTFEEVLQGRFGARLSAKAAPALDGSDAVMAALDSAIKGIDISQLAARPTPLRVALPQEAQGALADLGGGVLFLRAEAHYLGGGARFVRTAVPILLTVASAAGGVAAAGATGSNTFVYSVYGPEPSRDTVLAQVFLVHSVTHELLWFGQAVLAKHYEDPGATQEVAARLAGQVPSTFFKKD